MPTFPGKPTTDDERRAELLRLSAVRGSPRVYVLGSFARYVTIYAQQVRALNLVDALAKSGVLSERSHVAVVGGGIAGLTAAAGAAVRGVEKVDVFEQHESTMRIQRNSRQRFVHPHLYDWPIRSGHGDEAGLPLMSWTAGRASEVVAGLDGEWEKLRGGAGGRLGEPRTSCGEIGISSHDGGPVVEAGGEKLRYDAILLAIGFGLDRSGSTDGYWEDSAIDGLGVAPETTWLVSGAGDGALTDLMRLCILDFEHQKVLKEVVKVAEKEAIGETLLRGECECEAPGEFEELYREAARTIEQELDRKLRKRRLEQVWLNASREGLFLPSSSMLNRLITAYLLNRGRFELVEGKIKSPERVSGGFRVAFEDSDRPALEVDHVIVRHGPDKPLGASRVPGTWQPFAELWRRTRRIRRQWGAARQNQDWTRERLFEDHEFEPATARSAPLRIDFGDRFGCVLLTGENEGKLAGQTHALRVENALKRFRKRGGEGIVGRPVDLRPRHLRASDVFASSAAYERAVRALCDAELAVVDVTDLESAVMLLLGIRATVRRGITLTVTTDDPAENLLPFNLSALNPLPIGRSDDALRIAVGIESGAGVLKAQPQAYLDLPVFDAVRQLGEDHVPLEPEDQILILRWFDERYRKLADPAIEEPLKQQFDNDESVITILDSMSPQLVDQRLYAAIRRTRLCVADWTGWRPNVFFEIGVRLAVNKTDPLFVLCEKCPEHWPDAAGPDWPAAPEPGAEQLRDFFNPAGFEVNDSSQFNDRIEEFVDQREVRAPGAKLSPGRTYAIVSETVDRALEPGGLPVHEYLSKEATALAGPAVPEGGMAVPVLFGDVLADRALRAATEHQLAAWYYLGERYRLFSRARGDDPHLEALIGVGRELLDRIRRLPDDEYGAIAEDIRAALRKLDPDPENDDA